MDAVVRSVILHLDSEQNTVENAGGKGYNLSRLSRAGFPVPPGFILSTAAYRSYVQGNNLAETIQEAIGDTDLTDVSALEATSQTIRAQFRGGQFPRDLSTALQEACTACARVGLTCVGDAQGHDAGRVAMLRELERKVLWLASYMIHHANLPHTRGINNYAPVFKQQ